MKSLLVILVAVACGVAVVLSRPNQVPYEAVWVAAVFVDFLLLLSVLNCTRRALRQPSPDRCVHCGYSTAGIRDRLCPECGRLPGGPLVSWWKRSTWLVATITIAGLCCAMMGMAVVYFLVAYAGEPQLNLADGTLTIDVYRQGQLQSERSLPSDSTAARRIAALLKAKRGQWIPIGIVARRGIALRQGPLTLDFRPGRIIASTTGNRAGSRRLATSLSREEYANIVALLKPTRARKAGCGGSGKTGGN